MQRVMSIGVLSLGKLMGIIGVAMGLLIGVVYGGIMILFGLIGAGAAEQDGASFAAVGIGGGLAVMIFAPVPYGAMSFVFGLLYALIINVALKWIGGLELEIRGPEEPTY